MKVSKLARGWGMVFGLVVGLFATGCHSGTDRRFSDVPGLTGGSPQTAAAVATAPAPAPAPDPGATSDLRTDVIKVGDQLTITISDTPNPVQPIEDRVRDDGTIHLIQNLTFKAAGKTRGALEKEVHDTYVPQYFKTMTVQIKQQVNTQFYFVDGEVRKPDRQIYISRLTVLKAIASANGFTDFAWKSNVLLTRADGTTVTINCIKAQRNPKLDLEIFPGDRIQVFRKPNPFVR